MKKCTSVLLFLWILSISNNNALSQQNMSGVFDLGVPPDIETVDALRLSQKNAMAVTENEKIWYSTRAWYPDPDYYFASWLVQYDAQEESWEIFHSENTPLLSDTIYSLHAFEGKLYVGTSHGIVYYDGDWNLIAHNEDMPDHHAMEIWVTADKIFAGGHHGLSVLSEGVWTQYNTANSDIVGDTVQAITLDNEGKLWIGTNEGLSMFDADNWTNYTMDNSGLPENNIASLASDGDNKIWIGTAASGLFCLTDEEVKSFTQLHYVPISPGFVRSIGLNAEGEAITSLTTESGHTVSVKIASGKHSVYTYGHEGLYVLAGQDAYIGRINNPALIQLSLEEARLHDQIAKLNINQVGADFSAAGGIAWERGLHSYPAFEIPAGEGKSTLFTQRLWIGGLNEGADLHLSAERYRQLGRDFWPGPVTYPQAFYQQEQEKWNRLWKIDKETIDYHKANWSNADYEMPEVILNWPAHGDTSIGQEWFMAPYQDENANGIYEPELGDYPIIRGDQALYFVFNDDRYENTESSGQPLGVEIRGMAYGFNAPDDEVLNQTVFVNYLIVNRSEMTYDSVYFGKFADFDIGYAWDDFIGCDTSLHSYFAYNGAPVDGDGGAGTYGDQPPAQAITFFNQPLTSFMYMNNTSGDMGDPQFAPQYYNYLKGKWKNGQPMHWGGNGFPGGLGTTDEMTAHMFPDNPNSAEGWHEVAINNDPGDRQGLGSAFVGLFEPGRRICFDMAFVFGQDADGDHLESVNVLKANIQHIREYFYDHITDDCFDMIATDLIETQPQTLAALHLFPNPAGTHVRIAYTPDGPHAHYRLFNGLGSLVQAGSLSSANTLVDVSQLAPGVYVLVVQDGERYLRQKLIKR